LQTISKDFSVLTGKAGGFIDLKVYKKTGAAHLPLRMEKAFMR
jgi:hypothetical protein